jgi:hypothetical protein
LRAGDPIGDIAFNLTMALILKDVTASMQRLDAVWEGCPTPWSDFATSQPPSGQAWAELAYVDDLAVAIRATCNDDVLHLADAALGAIIAAAKKRGLELTFGAGKTELLLSPKGPGTRSLRERIANQAGQWLVVNDEGIETCSVPVVMAYRHLGTWVHNDAKPLHAVRDRITAARKAWGPLVRPFFAKKVVTQKV